MYHSKLCAITVSNEQNLVWIISFFSQIRPCFVWFKLTKLAVNLKTLKLRQIGLPFIKLYKKTKKNFTLCISHVPRSYSKSFEVFWSNCSNLFLYMITLLLTDYIIEALEIWLCTISWIKSCLTTWLRSYFQKIEVVNRNTE